MLYINQENQIHLDWTVMKGVSAVKEDFSQASVFFELRRADHYRCFVESEVTDNVISVDIPEGLDEGIYSVYLFWVKNEGHFNKSRCCMRSARSDLFAITTNSEEAAIYDSTVNIALTTQAGTYGYDGLDAYELALIRGETSNLDDWLDVWEGRVAALAEAEDRVESLYAAIVYCTAFSDTAPSSPSDGDYYYAPTSNLLYTYDADNTAWVEDTLSETAIYINKEEEKQYRWDGSAMVATGVSETELATKQDTLAYYTEDTTTSSATIDTSGTLTIGALEANVSVDNVAVTAESFTYNDSEVATATDLADKQDALTYYTENTTSGTSVVGLAGETTTSVLGLGVTISADEALAMHGAEGVGITSGNGGPITLTSGANGAISINGYEVNITSGMEDMTISASDIYDINLTTSTGKVTYNNNEVVSSAYGATKIWTGTQAEYTALGTYDSGTIYLTTD